MDTLTVWHWAGESLYACGTLPSAGATLPVEAVNGHHGSVLVIDALRYAQGPMLAQRELSGIATSSGYLHCASQCRMLTDYVDASELLSEFAARAARRAIAHAARALDSAGFREHADKLRALPDGDLSGAARRAMEVACMAAPMTTAAVLAAAEAVSAADRRSWSAKDAHSTAHWAARAAACAEQSWDAYVAEMSAQNVWLEHRARDLLAAAAVHTDRCATATLDT